LLLDGFSDAELHCVLYYEAVEASVRVPSLSVTRGGHPRPHGPTQPKKAVQVVEAEVGHQIGESRLGQWMDLPVLLVGRQVINKRKNDTV
jgi:hypothetical protein